MSAHIPEFRRIINGRTWDREWTAEAIEHHSRAVPWTDRLHGIALALVIAAAFVALVLAELGAL